MRELKLNVSALQQLLPRFGAIYYDLDSGFAILFYLCVDLGFAGFLVPHCLFTASGIIGYSIGLMFSSIIKDRSAVINITPGNNPSDFIQWAVIQFADMNSALRINKKAKFQNFVILFLRAGFMRAG